jgi:hypothetical protein
MKVLENFFFLQKYNHTNLNNSSKLVNGAKGIFKTYTNKNIDFHVVWIEFSNTNIGKYQRIEFGKICKTNILPNWTLICQIVKSLEIPHNKSQITIRK